MCFLFFVMDFIRSLDFSKLVNLDDGGENGITIIGRLNDFYMPFRRQISQKTTTFSIVAVSTRAFL